MTDATIGPAAPGPLDRWLRDQARREGGARRLEDALLGNRYAAYFVYRLRFFVARTLIAAVIHAIRVLLLYGAFGRDQFLVVVLAGAAAALVSDAWWGALERMRGRVRVLQQGGSPHQVPREIASWLRLSVRLSGLGLGLAGILAAWAVLRSSAGLGPADLLVVGIVAGASLDLTVRTYHSGVFALRRVYRPLPSLLLVDVAGLVVLLALWPLIGLWAFPAAEIVSFSVVMGLSLRYTSRTYRVMGFPSLPALLRLPVRPPTRRVLRGAAGPALASAIVGLEAIVLLLVVDAAGPGSAGEGAPMVALLVALGPVIRAGFEWARLLYFDLIRLGLPLLSDLRRRFDRAVLRLALVMGVLTWLVAAAVGVVLLGIRDASLLAVLVAFFVARSVLAAAQMRSFAGGAYRRLTLVGAGGLVAFGVALLLVPSVDGRVLGLAVVLGVSAALLIALPEPGVGEDRVAPLAEWLAELRRAPGPVTVTTVRFDARSLARGAPRERRQAEAWRRRQVARRVGRAARSAGGRVTWLSATDLAWWLPGRAPGDPGTAHVAAAADGPAALPAGRPFAGRRFAGRRFAKRTVSPAGAGSPVQPVASRTTGPASPLHGVPSGGTVRVTNQPLRARPARPGRSRPRPTRAARDLADPGWIARLTGGLIADPPTVQRHPDGRSAAAAIGRGPLDLDLDVADPPVATLVALFHARFPGGTVHDVLQPPPAPLAALDSRERAGVLRAGLWFARELRSSSRDHGPYDVSALAQDGSLRLLFLAPLSARVTVRRAWRHALRERTLRAAIRG